MLITISISRLTSTTPAPAWTQSSA
jgi:hypothetical protein